MNLRIVSTLFVLLLPIGTWAKVRKIEVQKDQIITVKTALGVATIIQVPDNPNSIVVGDQSAFKVEYLDQAITIKPLHGNARSNLYIYTDYRRFNVQLVATHESLADYVVYLENPKEKIKSSPIAWRNFRNHLKNESLTFETKRLAKTPDGILLIEFEIKSNKSEKFKPDWIWLTQSGVVKPVHNMALSSAYVSPQNSVKGILQVLRSDVTANSPLKIELRRAKTSYLTIPSGALWK